MLGNECISNGTFLRDSSLQIAGGQDGYIYCVLPGETLNGGQWLKPDGEPVNCTYGGIKNLENSDPRQKDPFFCTDNSPDANITMYLLNDDYFEPAIYVNGVQLADVIETEYKCCLPTACSDPSTNIMTVNVFGKYY